MNNTPSLPTSKCKANSSHPRLEAGGRRSLQQPLPRALGSPAHALSSVEGIAEQVLFMPLLQTGKLQPEPGQGPCS